jgi:hypothetical protein
MTFARWTFRLAGIYGLLAALMGYVGEARVSRDYPPAVTHLEYYYGFVGLVFAWQVAFLVISTDPPRYRSMMPVAVLEKVVFVVPAAILWWRAQLPPPMVIGATIDGLQGILFLVAFLRTPTRA